MDFLKTQLGQVLEQIKMAMVAQTPVVYIPTDQLEVVNDLLKFPTPVQVPYKPVFSFIIADNQSINMRQKDVKR